MAYGPIKAADASGRLVPAQLSLGDGQVQILVDDAGATYPLDIDSAVTASRAPVASFGGSPGAFFGISVAISADGREALVGAEFANSAYLFAATAGAWRTTPVATFRGGSGGFGFSVALSGDGQVALVGAPFTSSNEAGAVYVYKESAGGWPTRPVATLSGRSGDFLGSSVALSADGQEALLGAPAAGAGFRGAAYLYAESAGSWRASPIASFPSSSRSGDGLGSSVALSADGQVALVGAPYARSGKSAAFLYAESAGSWPTTPTASFIGSARESLGWSVALSADGRVALVGAPFAGPVNGAAYVYSESAGSWATVPVATFTGSLGQSLGSSVALSAHGLVALVGGPGAILGGGTTNVYTESAGRWHTSPVAAFRGSSGERLGSSVALSAGGGVALVGAYNAGGGAGAAFAYTSPG